MTLFLQQLANTQEPKQLFCGHHGMGQPKFFLGIVEFIRFDVGFRRGEELRTVQLVEKGADFLCGEEPPDFGYKGR
jgi:hypothetical protein